MLVLAATAAGAAKAEELDGEILSLVREFKDRNAEIEKLEAIENAYGRDAPEGHHAAQKISLLVDRGWEIRDLIADLPAKTPEGLRAKAWIALWETCDGEIGAEPVEGDSRVAWSLALDVLGRAGA